MTKDVSERDSRESSIINETSFNEFLKTEIPPKTKKTQSRKFLDFENEESTVNKMFRQIVTFKNEGDYERWNKNDSKIVYTILESLRNYYDRTDKEITQLKNDIQETERQVAEADQEIEQLTEENI